MIIKSIKIGMPNLTYNGLDLVWLLKETGNQHWQSLGELKNSEHDGQRLYASFFYISMIFKSGYSQDSIKEDDHLSIETSLKKFNRQIYQSTHDIKINDQNIAQVILESSFVKKAHDSNRLISAESKDIDIPITDSIHLSDHKSRKHQNRLTTPMSGNRLIYSPEFYFNGVKILYFANYLNLIALSEFHVYKQILPPIDNVEIFYFSNLNPEDQIKGLTHNDGNLYETFLYKEDNTCMCQSLISRIS